MSQSGIINTTSGPVPSNVATTYVTDSGNAVPASNVLNVLGNDGITTSGSGNTITVHNVDSFSPNSIVHLFDDFLGVNATITGGVLYSNYTWNQVGVFSSGAAGISTNPGLLRYTGTTNSIMLATASPAQNQIVLGAGALTVNWVIKTAVLSNGTNTYILRCGLSDTQSLDPVNGVYFEYTHSSNSGNWMGKTAQSSSRSTANSSTAVQNSTFVNLQISVNANATSVSFYVNGTQIANSPLAANIPTATIAPYIEIVQTAGTVPAGSVLIDLFYLTQTLTTAR